MHQQKNQCAQIEERQISRIRRVFQAPSETVRVRTLCTSLVQKRVNLELELLQVDATEVTLIDARQVETLKRLKYKHI